jgi:gas vesicle protein
MSSNINTNEEINFAFCARFSPNIEVSCMEAVYKKANTKINYIHSSISSLNFLQTKNGFEQAYKSYKTVNSVNNHNKNNILENILHEATKKMNIELNLLSPFVAKINDYKTQLGMLFKNEEILPEDYQKLTTKLSEISQQSSEKINNELEAFKEEIENAQADYLQEKGDFYIPNEENDRVPESDNVNNFMSGVYVQQDDVQG